MRIASSSTGAWRYCFSCTIERTASVSQDTARVAAFIAPMLWCCSQPLVTGIIHDWPDDTAQQILKTVRTATWTGTTVVLIECVIPPHDRDFLAKWVDLNMLVANAGRERKADEYRTPLQQSGLHMTRIVPTASPIGIAEANTA